MKRALVAGLAGLCAAALMVALPGGASRAQISGAATDPGSPDCVLGPFADCPNADLAERNLNGLDLSGANFSGATMDRVVATGATFTHAQLTNVAMADATLTGAVLDDADATGARITHTTADQLRAVGLDAAWSMLEYSNFTGSDLTSAYFGGATATGVDFTDAVLEGAVFNNANLTRAVFSGANLSNAKLRNADLTGAVIDASTTLAGADLSGALWLDGKTCREGSIGTCIPDPNEEDEADGSLNGGTGGAVFSIIKLGVELGKIGYDCHKNVPETGKCWQKPDLHVKQYRDITAKISEIRQEVSKRFDAINNAINAIVLRSKKTRATAVYEAAKVDLENARLALQKLEEYDVCLSVLVEELDADRKCQLSNQYGVDKKDYPISSIDDFFAGAEGPLSGSMAYGGPAARLYFSTLWRFGGEAAYSPTKINDHALLLLERIGGGGDFGIDGLDGVLGATLDWQNSVLNVQQGGRATSAARFLTPSYLASMNAYASYFVDDEIGYFTANIAALKLRSLTVDGPKSKLEGQMAVELEKLAIGDAKIGLGKQLDDYTVDLKDYDVSTSNADKVAFVPAPDGHVYRIQVTYPASQYPFGSLQDCGDEDACEATSSKPPKPSPTPHPRPPRPAPPDPDHSPQDRRDFTFPTYTQMTAVATAVSGEAGAKWSVLQKLYPKVLPQGQRAAWWANAGASYRLFNLEGSTGSAPRYASVIGAPYYTAWSEKVSWPFGEMCVVPVRLWDTTPSYDDAFAADRAEYNNTKSYGREPPENQRYAVWDGTRGPTFIVNLNSLSAFKTVVTSAAAPAFDVNLARNPQKFEGTGVLWRCNGHFMFGYGKQNALSASWVSMTPYEAKNLFARYIKGPRAFESCDDLHEAAWAGIARPGARDDVSEAGQDPLDRGVSAHQAVVDAQWYEANKGLDEDHDGIACEVGP